jgi:hypothetical protein
MGLKSPFMPAKAKTSASVMVLPKVARSPIEYLQNAF